jgi:glycosyltransferase involved in cell wall biosynthesis
MPLFSVIVPTYNRLSLVVAAVESVLRQECTDYELIVVDDGSTDGTAEALAAFGDRIRVVRQANQGQSAARNAGINAATGEYVAFLDSDDMWFPWTLANVERAMRELGRPACVATRSRLFSERLPGLEAGAERFEAVGFVDLFDFFTRVGPAVFETGVLIVRLELLRGVGGFLPTGTSEDVDLCLRLGCAAGFIRQPSPPSFAKRSHAGNISHQVKSSANGLRIIYGREKGGSYPGGSSQRRARLGVITFLSRAVAMQALEFGERGVAWELYLRCFAWHVRLGRVRFLLGFPVVWMVTLFRGGKNQNENRLSTSR